MRFWLLLIFVGLFSNVFAQQYYFRDYSLEEGLPQSEILHMVLGPKGGIWVGTNGGGVARFNGQSFDVYDKKRIGILHNQVARLLFDSQGQLWMGTLAGISKFDGKKVQNFPLPKKAASELVYVIYEDKKKKGRIWYATGINNYLHYIENGKTVDFKTEFPKQLGNKVIQAFFQLPNGNFLITANRKTYEYDGQQLKDSPIQNSPGFKGKLIQPFLYDSNGYLWIWLNGAGNVARKLFRYKTGVAEEIQIPKRFSRFVFGRLAQKDSRGNLWMPVANGNGLLKYDGKNFQHFNQKNGLNSNIITCTLEDEEGNMWISSRGVGLTKYSGDRFVLYDKKTSNLSSNMVRAMYQDGVGNYWFGTQSTGLVKLNGTTTTNYLEKVAAQNGRIHDFLRLNDRQFLITTTRRGLFKFDGQQFTPANQEYGIPKNRGVSASFRDGDTFWFGVNGLGVIKYSPQGIDTLTAQKDGLINNLITHITKDQAGNMWFSSLNTGTGGLSRFDGKKMTSWAKNSPLKTDLVMQVASDQAGGVWVATYGVGVMRIFEDKFTQYTTDQGIGANQVYNIIADDDGNIWLGVQNGVDKIVLDKQGKIITIKHYTKDDGFMGIENNGKAVYKDLQGNLWFGTINGAMKYNANARRLHHKNTKINLTDVKLFLRSVDWDSKEYDKYRTSSEAFSGIPQQLQLPHNLNNISFHFEGISYYLPEKVSFQWRLKGLDKDWSPKTRTNEITYTNIPPGKYTLELKASNSWDQWSSNTFTYDFEVRKPYWQTWWFRILVAIVGVLLITLSFRWRMSALKARKKELERLVDEKTAEVRSQNGEILEKNAELEQQKEEILVQNEQIHLQNEEILVQRDQLEQAFQNVTLLSEIGQKVTANLSIDKIADTLYEQISMVMEVDEFGIGLYNPEQKALVFGLIYENGRKLPSITIPISQQNRLSVYCFLRKENLLTGNLSEDEEYLELIKSDQSYKPGDLLKSLLCVPVMEGEEAIGVITIQSAKENAYDSHHLSMILSLSAYVAIAAKNSNIFHQVQVQKQEIEIKNENITASIQYAKQIQQAILGSPKDVNQYFDDSFIMLKPRDIVSGDFYWYTDVVTKTNGVTTQTDQDIDSQRKVVLVAADCTGHGVPGAFMTLMGSDFLDDIVCKERITQPDLVLQAMEQKVTGRLQKDAEDQMNDGMDMSIVSFDRETMELQFAGAKNPLWVVTDGGILQEYKGSKYPIGGSSQYHSQKTFELTSIQLQKNDVFYLFSDGFQDQFGGEEGKKFMKSRLRELIEQIYCKPLKEQKEILEDTLRQWMSYLPKNSDLLQVDDILMIGVRV
ncbi:hypothetical protein BKI52_12095 [marine bacterium AO1-C]|nr:hypothetical protein BKI52_12095 [marine bacterium AO1-C]